MNLDRVRAKLSAPFRPFVLRASDGREYFVRRPDCILVGPNTLGVLNAEGEIVAFDPLHVVAIEDLPVKRNDGRRRAS